MREAFVFHLYRLVYLAFDWGVSHVSEDLLLLQQLEKRAGPVEVHLSWCLSELSSLLYEIYPCCWNVCSNVLFLFFISFFFFFQKTAASASTVLFYSSPFLLLSNNTLEIIMCVGHIYHANWTLMHGSNYKNVQRCLFEMITLRKTKLRWWSGEIVPLKDIVMVFEAGEEYSTAAFILISNCSVFVILNMH